VDEVKNTQFKYDRLKEDCRHYEQQNTHLKNYQLEAEAIIQDLADKVILGLEEASGGIRLFMDV